MNGRRWLSRAITDISNIKNYKPHLTYLVAYPKTGSTWLRFMLAQILIKAYDLPCELNANINAIADLYPDLPLPRWTHDGAQMLSESGNTKDSTLLFVYGGRVKFIRSNVLLTVRDPRDIVVSLYHQLTKRSLNPMEFDTMSDFIRHPLIGFPRIIRFYTIWSRNRYIPRRFHIIRYEDLSLNGYDTLMSLVDFLSLPDISLEVIKEVYDYSEANNMRKIELSGNVNGISRYDFGTDPNSLKVRKAKIGSYQEEMSPEDIRYCNAEMQKFPSIFGYTIE